MIDMNDIIVKKDKCRYFKCYCSKCGSDKAYQTKYRYKTKPLCIKCATNISTHRAILRNNHWSRTGKYSPKIYKTELELAIKKERELQYSRDYNKKYYQQKKHEIHKKRKEYEKTNVNYKLAKRLRSRLNIAIKTNYRAGSAVRDLGCTIEELKRYLESKFQGGMSWDNYGRNGWHIDHIRPLSGYDLSNTEQVKEACHYSNLQPLWRQDNLSKGDR